MCTQFPVRGDEATAPSGDDTRHLLPPSPAAGPPRRKLPRRRVLATLAGAGLAVGTAAVVSGKLASSPAPPRRHAPPRHVVTPAAAPAAEADFTFADYFRGPAGSLPDARKWAWNTGPGAQIGGNNETEIYVKSPVNSYLDGASHLVIAATANGSGGFDSARILSRYHQTFGHWQARIAVPDVTGCTPAFWFLGHGQWPGCGEIDGMEDYGSRYIQQTVWNGTATDNYNNQTPWNSDFHLYQLDWEEDFVRLFYDGELLVTATPQDLRPWPFSDNGGAHCLLNIATGGKETGGVNPDPATLPARMIVDYVRCWK
jgi:beta-glucanase (GH16 family)